MKKVKIYYITNRGKTSWKEITVDPDWVKITGVELTETQPDKVLSKVGKGRK